MNKSRGTATRLVLSSMVAAVVSSLTLSSEAAAGAPATEPHGSYVAGDFNGDGYPDLVLAADLADEGEGAPGEIDVVPGTATRAPDDAATVFIRDYQVGLTATGDRTDFGKSIAVGDLNKDGYADLAVGAPSAKVNDVENAGAVVVFYGSADGIVPAHTEILTEGATGSAATVARDDEFGSALTIADVDGDGIGDLVASAPGERDSSDRPTGALELFLGSAGGVVDAVDQQVLRSDTGLGGAPMFPYGESLNSGDFNHDGHADVAAGSPSAKVGQRHAAGRVDVLYGATSGLSTSHARTFSFATPGVAGKVVNYRQFGKRLVRNDFNHDGYADLAISAPGRGGAVTALYGSKQGLGTSRAQYFTEATRGVPGSVWHRKSDGTAQDQFGLGLAVRSAGSLGSKYPTLYIGVPQDYAPTKTQPAKGTLIALRGSAHGLTATGVKVLADPDWSTEQASGWGTLLAGGPRIAVAEPNRDRVRVLGVGGDGSYGSVELSHAATAMAW